MQLRVQSWVLGKYSQVSLGAYLRAYLGAYLGVCNQKHVWKHEVKCAVCSNMYSEWKKVLSKRTITGYLQPHSSKQVLYSASNVNKGSGFFGIKYQTIAGHTFLLYYKNFVLGVSIWG